jgi:hypothetical protein
MVTVLARICVWLLVLALVAAACGVWASFGRTLAHAKPIPVANVPVPNAVVWRGRVYQSRTSLAAALARQGRSYAGWAKTHPHAAALLSALPEKSAVAGRTRSTNRT